MKGKTGVRKNDWGNLRITFTTRHLILMQTRMKRRSEKRGKTIAFVWFYFKVNFNKVLIQQVMKYSNYLGVIAALLLIVYCFLPWVYIDPLKTVITGVRADNTNFGKPGALHIIFSTFSIILFLIPSVWAKRANLILSTLNFAWAIRNFLLITQCELGECPEKLSGIYAIVFCSIIMLLMSMLPKVKLQTL